MSDLVASIIPHAVAVAISPMPIAALILLLLSNRPRSNSVAFLIGWSTALIVNIAFFALAFNAPLSNDPQKSTIASMISIILGAALLILAVRQWLSRPKNGQTPPTPKWMKAIETISPLKSFALAFTLVTINAKNTILDIAAGVTIGQKANSIEEALTATVIFVVVASSTIALPVIAFLLFGRKLEHTLTNLKEWFIYNSATILFVLFLILGVNIISKAFIH